MAILCFEWITTVIKYKLITRNRLWNTGAVTQESLQNSSLGKSLYLLELKKNKSTVRFFGVCAFVLSATELMKCSSDYVLHNHLYCCCLKLNPFFISYRIFLYIFPRKLSKNCKNPIDFMFLWRI